ncbi:MAG: trypsin-like peptidase domain-containing protein [Bdellovibrionales bacterium]|nr:trypsin-like peptidase domain-containing protein [Bdellovibrionales bacterium]
MPSSQLPVDRTCPAPERCSEEALSALRVPPVPGILNPSEIYALVSPSVVAMKIVEEKEGPRHRSMDLDDPLPSYGSGFVYDRERKIIVTNWHVAEVQDKLLVEIGDETYEAKVLGVDPRLDLAVLQVKCEREFPPAVRIGNPLASKVGERVYTIGSPFGFDGTFGQGIVSGPARTMHGPGGVMVGLVQHNAVTNPGNSGGVLLNERGEVIAMNTIILTKSGGHQGFALSVPIDLVANSVEEILGGGQISEPSLGLTLAETKDGLAIVHIEAGSAADRAGLFSEISFERSLMGGEEKPCFERTAFITHINGKRAVQGSDLYASLARTGAKPVRLSLRQGANGKAYDIELKPDEVKVPDVMALREVMKKYSPAGPSCEHIRFLSEIKRTRPEDIPLLLGDAPFVVVSEPPKESAFARILPFARRSDERTTVSFYVDRSKALAVLLESGKGIRWLESQLDKLGLAKVSSTKGDILHYSGRVPNHHVVFLSMALSMIAHGSNPKELERAGLLGGDPESLIGGLPPEVAEKLERLLNSRR